LKSNIENYIKTCEHIIKNFNFNLYDDTETTALAISVTKQLESDFSYINKARVYSKIICKDPLHVELFVLIVEKNSKQTDLPITFKVIRAGE
jgi:hypothetical protein